MNRIIYINLTKNTISETKYDMKETPYYGKSLAGYLVRNNVKPNVERYSDDNCIVITPGLLTGTATPCTGRITVAAKENKEKGTQFANLGGPFSQKLASMNIAAIVISGVNHTKIPAIINITLDQITVEYISEVNDKSISDVIHCLRNKFGKDSSVLGIGTAGDHMLPLAAIFNTYPLGEPSYTCARGGMGDIFGSKGLKALVISGNKHFNASVFNKQGLNIASKELSKSIIEHKICGGALPAYGSITLMKMMSSSNDILNFDLSKTSNKGNAIDGKINIKSSENSICEVGKDKVNNDSNNPTACSRGININRNCAPLCVIGCLNRHVSGKEKYFRSPAESEVLAALKECFEISDSEFASDLNYKAFEIGIDSVEFVFSCALFYKLKEQSVTKELLMDALNEVKNMTLVGRVIGSKTNGIFELFKDKKELQNMVTKPSIDEQDRFTLMLPNKPQEFKDIDDKNYLYAWMTLLSSLGICLFSAFAIIEDNASLDRLANLYFYKTGIRVDKITLIKNALECLSNEEEYEKQAKNSKINKKVPEFVKVLHRYFENKKIMETN